ncbi:MAG: hypothetical protein HRT57_13575, partial [Crocinitomicaceae bacterium]|nr:hypothetical protein [Crocinitomicaceae bacterium]
FSSTDDQNMSGSGLAGTTLTIGIENGTNETVDLSSLVDDLDADPTNEIQALSISGNVISLSSGGSITVPSANGSETKIDPGSNTTVSGLGTTASPYTISVAVSGITSAELADDAVTAAKINADVAGNGLIQNIGTGALEVDVSGLVTSVNGETGAVSLRTVDGESLTSAGGDISIGVVGVSGDGVNNTNPASPVLSFPSADQVDDNASTNKFVTAVDVTNLSNLSGTNTGDETPATIKSKYESNANTNAFTDAEKINLSNQSGINTGDQNISGIATNVSDIATNTTAIALNTAKTGITVGQASAITANTVKTSNAIHTGDVTGGTVLTIGADVVDDSHIDFGVGKVSTADLPEETNLYYTEARVSANSSVSANTAKTGITTGQANEITANTAKVGLTSGQATIIANTSGINTGDQDISGSGLSGTILTIGIENGSNEVVNLSSLVDDADADATNELQSIDQVLETGSDANDNSLVNLGSVGVGTETVNSNAKMEISSTSKGFLPPRMTEDQRNTIAAPTEGLIVYCTNCAASGELQYFNGAFWLSFSGARASSPTAESETISAQFSTTNGTANGQDGQSFLTGGQGGYLSRIVTNGIGGASGTQLTNGIANSTIIIREYVNDDETGASHALTGNTLGVSVGTPLILDYTYGIYYPSTEFKFAADLYLKANTTYVFEIVTGSGVGVYIKATDMYTDGQAYDINGVNLHVDRDIPFSLYLVHD